MSVSKNNWLKLLAFLVVTSLLLAACGPTPTPVEKIVTQVVKETVMVAGTPQEVEKEVTKVVEVPVVVTATPKPAPAAGKTIVIGMPSDFDILDPNITTATRIGRIGLHLCDPLLWQPEPGKFVPGLAKEWAVNEDATEYTFKLRDDVTFHDGTPFTADSVKFTLDRIADPANKSQMGLSVLGPYSETQIINDYEVKVKFKAPYAPFLDSVSGPYLVPEPRAAAEAAGYAWGMGKFVCTGPFKFDSMILDNEIVLVKNPDYNWGSPEMGMNGPSKIDKIVYKLIAEPATRSAALLAGEIDFIDEPLEVDFETFKADPAFKTVEIPQAGMGDALVWNHERPPTDELAVRKAMQLAMDKQGMIDTVFNGYGKPSCAMITSATFGWCPETCDVAPYDLEKAKQVLEEAGWVDTDGDGIRERNGQKLVVAHYYRADAVTWSNMGAFMKDNFAKVGIEVELNGLSRSGYFDAVRSGKHNTQGWSEWTTDPDMMVRGVLHSSNIHGGTNRSNLADPEIDALIEAQAAEPDPAKRAEIVCELLKKVKEEAHFETWLDPMLLYVYDANIQNVIMYQSGSYPWFAAADITE